MGNQEFLGDKPMQKEWIQVTINGKSYIKNLITGQNFQFKVLQKDKKNQKIAELIQRSMYNIPRTPKTIILSEIQTEVKSKNLRYDSKSPDILEVLKEFIITAQSLYKKYGPFHVTEEMLGFTEALDAIMWINEQFQKTNIQYVQQSRYSELELIKSILQIIGLYSSFNIKNLLHNKIYSFKSLIINLNSLICGYKLGKIQNQFKSVSKQKTTFPIQQIRHIPSYYGQNKVLKFQNIKAQKIKSPKKIPQFIKKQIGMTNTSLLRSLPHKKTMTIQNLQENELELKLYDKKNDKKEGNYNTEIKKIKSAQIIHQRLKKNIDQNNNIQFSWIDKSHRQRQRQNGSKYQTFDKKHQNHSTHDIEHQSILNQIKQQTIPYNARIQLNYSLISYHGEQLINNQSFPTTTTAAKYFSHQELYQQFNQIFGELIQNNGQNIQFINQQCQKNSNQQINFKFYK